MSETNPSQPSKQTVRSETRRFWKKLFLGGLVLLCLFGFVVWICLFHEVPLEISPETTYITEPLTADGRQVDYFRAIELMRYPPNMKTDENGFRMIIRAIGVLKDTAGKSYATAQIYEKLGLDPAVPPTMTFEDPLEFIQRYVDSQPSEEPESGNPEAISSMPGEGFPDMGLGSSYYGYVEKPDPEEEFEEKITRPWTAEELPMMTEWLKANEPAIDLIAKAAQQPNFVIPWFRENENEVLILLLLPEQQRLRSFARALSTRANYRIAQGNLDGAIDDIIALKTMGRHAGHNGCIIEHLIGIALEGMANSIEIAASVKHQPTEAQLQRLLNIYIQTTVSKIPPREDTQRNALIERYILLDTAQKFLAMSTNEKRETLGTYHELAHVFYALDYFGSNQNIFMKSVNQAYDSPERYPDTMKDLYSSLNPNLLFPSYRSKFYGKLFASFVISYGDGIFYEAVKRSQRLDQLQAITLALLIYEKQYGHLPPAWTVDGQGKPLHSWRVLLLPYLGEEAKKLYEKIRLDEPWDSEHNQPFHEAAIPFYQCPGAELAPGETLYSVVVGPKTAFRGGKGVKFNELGSHLANLILVTERKSPVCWMEPNAELTKETLSGEIEADSSDSKLFGFRSGSVQALECDYLSEPYPDLPDAMLGSGSPPSWENLQKLLEGNMEKIDSDE